jgi:hypothetical protein
MKMKGKKLPQYQFHFPGLLEAVLKLKKTKKKVRQLVLSR